MKPNYLRFIAIYLVCLLLAVGVLVAPLPSGQAYAQTSSDASGLAGFGLDDATLSLFGKFAPLLGFFLFGAIASLKRWVELQGTRYTWPALAWRAIALGAGVVCAVVLHLSGYGAELSVLHATGWPAVLLFGLFAGVIAMFGRDGLKTASEWRGAAVGAGIAAAQLAQPQPTGDRRALLAAQQGTSKALAEFWDEFDKTPRPAASALPPEGEPFGPDILPPEGLIEPSPELAQTLADQKPA